MVLGFITSAFELNKVLQTIKTAFCDNVSMITIFSKPLVSRNGIVVKQEIG